MSRAGLAALLCGAAGGMASSAGVAILNPHAASPTVGGGLVVLGCLLMLIGAVAAAEADVRAKQKDTP